MGNFVNTAASKWGLNLFWYNFWIIDKNYINILQQDNIIKKLMFIFLNYGILFPKNIFLNKFWYFYKFNLENYQNIHNIKYYRVVNFKSLTMGIDSHYAVRNSLKNTYFTKIWIMRYQNWLVINYYCFFPKMKNKLNIINRKKRELPVLFNKKNFFFIVKRIKLMIFFFFNKNFFKNNYYAF